MKSNKTNRNTLNSVFKRGLSVSVVESSKNSNNARNGLKQRNKASEYIKPVKNSYNLTEYNLEEELEEVKKRLEHLEQAILRLTEGKQAKHE